MDISKIKVGSTSYDIKDTVAREKVTPILYDDLVTLRNNSQLIPGQLYRITDYATTTSQNNTRSAGNQFDIIVVADAVNKLNENARAILHSGDTYFSEAGANLSAWRLLYDLDNNRDKYLWAVPTGGYIMTTIEINERKFLRNATGDVDNATYPYKWTKDGTSWYTASETPSVNDTAYAASDGTGDTITIEEFCSGGKGVIYQMVDEWGNNCPYDFKNIQYLKYQAGSTYFSDSLTVNAQSSIAAGSGILNQCCDLLSLNGIDSNKEINIGYRLGSTGYRNGSFEPVDLSESYCDYRLNNKVVSAISLPAKKYAYTFTFLMGPANMAATVYDSSLYKYVINIKINPLKYSFNSNALYKTCLNNIMLVIGSNRLLVSHSVRTQSTNAEISGVNLIISHITDSKIKADSSLFGEISNSIVTDASHVIIRYINNSFLQGVTNTGADYISYSQASYVDGVYAKSIYYSLLREVNLLQTVSLIQHSTIIGSNDVYITAYTSNLNMDTCHYLTLTSEQTTSTSSLIKRLIIKYVEGTYQTPITITHNELGGTTPTTYLPANSQTISV